VLTSVRCLRISPVAVHSGDRLLSEPTAGALPAVLHWLTGYIGFHHIHHVCSKIPNYRLRECFDQNSEFRDARRLTLVDSLKCSRLSLWDEERQLLVSFRHALRCQRASDGNIKEGGAQ
jgi:fatty acid desaturase